jgi:hypothetical protein
MKNTNIFVFLGLGFLLSFPLTATAQVQTTNQCLATTRARAGLTLSKAEMQSLCENNSDEVVNCAITMMQGNRFSGNLSQSVKDCRKQFVYSYY